MRWRSVSTPIGPIAVAVVSGAICRALLQPEARSEPLDLARETPPEPLLEAAATQLTEYFTGQRTGFDLPLSAPDGVGSTFERAVWAELARIPYGEQHSYGQVAAALGEPGAARAVGTACNRNPLPIFVPCHRVVGAGGKLVGFGGGLARKRWLLEHEARVDLERAWG
ncbi:methylated-DNA--[protein]-cysteine S-methyltransferase [Natronosporangium hydrolyticum]|uniref:methylated-DNA--[protein]-cysteine S-methyltransferase n=1 Tax=Natronosporangium hydrolyticum TaxID=2811111 RepID=UPI001EFA17DA|nr:methylated-DNA--[protein]-cysteine S-methyltransferase [Natronosporangium hydrolyticum]